VSVSGFQVPATDPQPIFDAYRGIYETALLTSAVARSSKPNDSTCRDYSTRQRCTAPSSLCHIDLRFRWITPLLYWSDRGINQSLAMT
jgi:hypothetical protein